MLDALEFSIELALKAGRILQEFYSPAGLPSSAKPDQTVVTQADLASDELITDTIRAQFPGDGIISEELHHQLEDVHSPTWIIDPLDGTTNFSLGLSIWGVSIARLVNGVPVSGVIYFPMIQELYSATKDARATLNHSPIAVRAPDPSQPMSFFSCCSRSFRQYDINIPYKPRIMGSATYTFCMVARGTALLGFDAAPKIWDLAAIWLLVEQAGGMIAAFDGPSPFPTASAIDYSQISYPTLASATPQLFDFGHNRIRKK